MKPYKVKSLSHLSEQEIERGCRGTQFISFEAAIQLFQEKYGKYKPLGYRITEQGIEIIVD